MAKRRNESHIAEPDLWYVVGVVATDGCLCKDGRHIDITSKDRGFLNKIINSLGVKNRICLKYNAKQQKYFRIQIGNKNLYDFFLSIGLSQSKSLTLGSLKVPARFFTDFLRGVIDGDGCILRWEHPSNNNEQWSLRIYSGAEHFIKWLQNTIESRLRARGRLYKERFTLWTLKYGKMAAAKIIKNSYYEGCLALDRKMVLAKRCINSPRGWVRSKTILN
jgi:hypothetical protein